MLKILSTVTLVLVMVMTPLVGLIMISQDASKGEFMYPVKKGLESSILAVASLTPYTKAFFSVALANRRYEETEKLLASGENADVSLQELVTQTSSAASDIGKVSSSQQRAKLIADLSTAIEKYDKGLESAQVSIDTKSEINSQKTDSPRNVVKVSKQPINGNTSQPTPAVSSQPVPSAKSQENPPSQQLYDPALHEKLKEQYEAIERTRRELEELKRKLALEQKNLGSQPSPSISPSLPPIQPPRTSSPSPSARGSYGTATDVMPAASTKPSPSAVSTSPPSPTPSPAGKKKNNSVQDHVSENFVESEN